jgi:hypothetical protein
LIQARRSQKPKLDQEQIDLYFSPREVPTKPEKPNSLLSHQIKQSQTSVSNEKFSEFAKFEAFVSYLSHSEVSILFFRKTSQTPSLSTLFSRLLIAQQTFLCARRTRRQSRNSLDYVVFYTPDQALCQNGMIFLDLAYKLLILARSLGATLFTWPTTTVNSTPNCRQLIATEQSENVVFLC